VAPYNREWEECWDDAGVAKIMGDIGGATMDLTEAGEDVVVCVCPLGTMMRGH
jgi:hypothetical protein